ncbi:uncharacterized protein YndB with AHSA1/START domain [Microbacterium terrae]|uniref:Activator of Hsp90 ATPase homologue 1/2-like C-terminal domain-containing protein n=1 Tax=Microbacterium terrae TaxID=69369 RepID=A0A0M2HD29_9MICO|nr:SRPBCC family protein [Microbacterium terrae]KJL42045.1 hypothetical protein RS81_01201 [Microbacterium terrae]MBP1076692.1 uncharacterized protein YndB with AHSA1/START domain [Microbacterium terrae]GLJ97520.1 hypothetical protein GCM10017594_07170 [Microbacterium terrae]
MSLTESHPVLRMQAWRELRAAPAVVFDALVDPEKHMEWLAPPGSWGAVESTVDLRVGGVWESRFSPTPSTRVHDVQTYVAIEPHHRLITDLVSEATVDGKPAPALRSRIEITLAPTVWGTYMSVEQTGFPSAEMRDFFETEVWQRGFDRLEAFLARRG